MIVCCATLQFMKIMMFDKFPRFYVINSNSTSIITNVAMTAKST